MKKIETIKNTSTKSIELFELVEYLDRNVDFSSTSSICAAANEFGRLYHNKNLIKDFILDSLKNGVSQFNLGNSYTPPSLILHNGQNYLIRANLWRATREYGDKDINVYGLAHDHNFDFLTLNYFGPGYISEMYTYSYTSVAGYIGEHVSLERQGTLELTEGNMFFYRKNVDVHLQLPPESDSITINLMIKIPLYSQSKQFIFNVKKGVISDMYGGFNSRRHVFEIAKLLNDPQCNQLLVDILNTTSCSETKTLLEQK
ncbi:hypothetical protein PS673_02059 [Pseudomonas fluorescens]|jgi:hypothetical protein|uniref:Uncharacterized protein n=1 Tax=Pseudomonas fluorescens TaxID=294 RepID=A0A5E6S947_PSEFL|nr:hypothetical protein [Pseudomonas fluorescens]VVM76682.1 hypothetical protein PS673_02059 [Pseudomonas fluorescens]